MKKSLTLLLAALLFAASVAGCAPELYERALISAVGVDKTEGGCRVTVGGKMKFACVDGPDFDGHEVDFDEAMSRGAMYRDFELHAREETCNLFKQEVK